MVCSLVLYIIHLSISQVVLVKIDIVDRRYNYDSKYMYLYDFCLEMRHAYRIYEFFCRALSYLITGVAAPWVYLCDIWGRSVLHITTCSLGYQSERNITTCTCNTMYKQGKCLWHWAERCWAITFVIKMTQCCYITLQCWYQLIKAKIPYTPLSSKFAKHEMIDYLSIYLSKRAQLC